ncbi:MAG: magnesium-translocating P-type ATPase [Linnemannia gamsii]|nr:MAG: magnesium-translocating P-type ATPase [Linnemannia gamsii]
MPPYTARSTFATSKYEPFYDSILLVCAIYTMSLAYILSPPTNYHKFSHATMVHILRPASLLSSRQHAINYGATSSTSLPTFAVASSNPNDGNGERNDLIDMRPLSDEQVRRAKAVHGKNKIEFKNDQVWYMVLFHALLHPFNILLAILGTATVLTGDNQGGSIMFMMVLLSTLLRFWQEWKSAEAAQSLKSMVTTMTRVTRLYSCPEFQDPTPEEVVRKDIPIEDVVPGDWVQLSAGDLIPADVHVLESKDLFVSQATLTGEAMPVEKFAASCEAMTAWKQRNANDEMDKSAIPSGALLIPVQGGTPDLSIPSSSYSAASVDVAGSHYRFSKMTSIINSVKRTVFACFGIRRFDFDSNAHKQNEVDLSHPNFCFMGTSVISGTATVLVDKIGSETYFGSMAKELSKRHPESAFQMGVRNISWVFFGLMALMVPPVLLIIGLAHQNWADAALFALSVAVGLTPEMLPVIVSSTLARGAYLMSKERCIIKNLDAIINLGSMDVLCTDKTGTITENKVVLVRHVDFHGKSSIQSLQLAFLNSFFQTGLKNLLDVAVVEYFQKTASELPTYVKLGSGLTPAAVTFASRYQKLDEIPFDFVRRRMSVILKDILDNQAMLVSKGAVREILRICTHVVVPCHQNPNAVDILMGTDGQTIPALDTLVRTRSDDIKLLTPDMIARLNERNKGLSLDGLRVVAVAYRDLDKVKSNYSISDECNMVFAGLIAFLDPPKESAGPAIKEILSLGVEVKVLTGDSDTVCRKVCQEIGLPINSIVTTDDLVGLDDEQVALIARNATIFAKLTPVQKSRIIRVLKRSDRIVGFLGDGINDAPALTEADVGISVDTATDIAKESADVILLEKSLEVIAESIVMGRTTYGNTLKYIVMGISSNFGNVFSILVASLWLPFLPMLPIHILAQNMLYDISQATIPWDKMDKEFLMVPHRWNILSIFQFMVFMGPWSSIFDITTFLFMWFYFGIRNPSDTAGVTLFQTAWFTEGALTQLLVIHIIRSPKIPFVQTIAARPVIASSLIISIIVLVLPYISIFRDSLTMVELPTIYYAYLVTALLSYFAVTQLAKMMYLHIFKAWF